MAVWTQETRFSFFVFKFFQGCVHDFYWKLEMILFHVGLVNSYLVRWFKIVISYKIF